MGCLGNCSQAVMGSGPGERLPWRPEEHDHLGNSPVSSPPTPLWGCILRRCTPAGVPCPPATTSDRAPGPAPWVGREVAAPPHPPLGGRALAPSMPPQPPDLMARRKRQGRARLLGFITPHTTCSRTGSWPGSRQESWVQRGPEVWVGSGAPQGCPSAPEGQWGPCGEGQKDAVPLPGWQTS